MPKFSQRSRKSNWEAVGCKRGRCIEQTRNDSNALREDNSHMESNVFFHSTIALRNELIETIRTSECPQNKFFESVLGKIDTGCCWKPFHKLQWPKQSCSSCEPFLPATLAPLDECIIAIVWEATNSVPCQDVFTASPDTRLSNLWDLAVFLRSAASYQAKVENDELILLSLICLRSCLETLRLNTAGYLKEEHHQSCETEKCKIDSVSHLQTNVKLYMNDLQRVFFKKENIRSKVSWWLSAFYSLVIQGFVRRALLQISQNYAVRDTAEGKQYFQIAVRLFIASSGAYDPLIRDYATLGKNKEKEIKSDDNLLAQDFQAAQLSLQQYKWISSGTPCTADYLRKLYEDDLAPIHERFSRATPLSLGWLSDYQLLHLYKFIVPKGGEPYFELLPSCQKTRETPERVYLDPPRTLQKDIFPCLYPNCDSHGRIFKRPADLERHYRNVHASLEQKDQFPCDYRACHRIRDPFTRKDHFRDHLRDYHKEDLGCAKGEKVYNRQKWLKLQSAWIAERKIGSTWWRCPKCLCRVKISDSGYECRDCKISCDRERVERIEAACEKLADEGGIETSDQDGARETQTDSATGCAKCTGTAWVWNRLGTWDPCANCQPGGLGSSYLYEDWTGGEV